MTTIKPKINAAFRIVALLSMFFVASAGVAQGFIAPAFKFGWKYLDDAIEAASKITGKSLTPGVRKAALTQLRDAAVKHGDNAILAARKGGLELMVVAGKYGDDVWKFASKAPAGARALAVRPKELLPLTRRIGTEVLELEAKSPGMTKHVVKNFGDDCVRYFAKNVPAKDATRLIGYAGRADTQATRQMLLDYYKKGGTHFLEKLNWKHIMAGGLSAAMITSAYQISDGIQEGFTTVAKSSPEAFKETVAHVIDRATMPIVVPATLFGVGLAAIWLFRYYIRTRRKPVMDK